MKCKKGFKKVGKSCVRNSGYRKKNNILMLRELVLSPPRWFGWLLSTGAIVGIFHLMKIHALHTPWYNVLILFGVIVVVDIIKHFTRLR